MNTNISGLNDNQVTDFRIKYGSNELTPHETEGFMDKLIHNFKDPIIIILTGALVVIFILSLLGLTEWYEAAAIAVAVILATFVSTFSEFKNESSFQKLQEEASRIDNNVFRNGHLAKISVNDIVKGDMIFLQAGDKIPADGYLVQGRIKVNQASLTGESVGISKTTVPTDYVQDSKDFSSRYDLFRGSVVDDGEGVMKVETVGDHTFYGSLARELSDADDRLSPLQVKLKDLAKLISKFGYTAAIFIFITFTFQKSIMANNFDGAEIAKYFSDWHVFVPDLLDALVLSIIIVVAAIPEGLPMMIAIVLSLNMRKLLVEKVLVRRLLGIETAGSMNILFSDKTGTITKGKLEPILFIRGNCAEYNSFDKIPDTLRTLTGMAILGNTSSHVSPDGEIVGGNISERALIKFMNEDYIKGTQSLGIQAKKSILFNSARKFSATQITVKNVLAIKSDSVTLIKGAPEVLFGSISEIYNDDGKILPFDDKEELIQKMDKLADNGIRLIALAISKESINDDETMPNQAVLVGIIGISDEIREESKWAIDEVKRAGIQVVMITGDRKGTAAAIAMEVGLLSDENDKVLVSSELQKHSDDEIRKMLPDIRVIARALPSDKSRLVRLSKSVGRVVGMTGDGVNDSVALKQADIGVGMGSGSEVSKEASDIVILDDNFYSISNAIRYGRTIFKSIRKFIIFQLTVNVAAVSTAFFGPLIGIDFPLTIIQILWINIIMDTLAAIAYGGEPALVRYMEEKPVDREENILTKDMISSILTSGIFITAFGLFFLSYTPIMDLFVRDGVPNAAVHKTVFFNIFIFMIIFNGFNVRTERINILDHLIENKSFIIVMALILFLQVVFTYIGGTILRTVALNIEEWFIVVAFALLVVPVGIVRKLIVGAVR